MINGTHRRADEEPGGAHREASCFSKWQAVHERNVSSFSSTAAEGRVKNKNCCALPFFLFSLQVFFLTLYCHFRNTLSCLRGPSATGLSAGREINTTQHATLGPFQKTPVVQNSPVTVHFHFN